MLYQNVLRKVRKNKKIKIKDIASFLGKTRHTVSRWEQGQHPPCDADIRLMAQFLNVDVSVISDLKPHDVEKQPYFLELLNPIDQIQQRIKSNLTIEEKSWIFKLFSNIETLKNEVAFLKRENAKLTSITNSLQSFVYTKDKDLKYVFANSAFLAFLGVSQVEVKGKLGTFFWGEKDAEFLTNLEKKVLLQGYGFNALEITFPGTKGRRKGLLSITPMTNEEGKITGLTTTIEDITEQIAAKERLKLVEQAINKSSDALWIKSDLPIPHFLFVSTSISKISGINIDLIYKNVNCWLNLVHDSNKKEVKDLYEKKQNGQIEYKITDATGEIKWISEYYYFSKEENIEFGIIRDITEKKKAEINQWLLQYSFETARDGCWIKEVYPKNRYRYSNKTINEIWGWPSEYFYRDSNFWKTCILPCDIGNVIDYTEKGKVSDDPLIFRIKRPDGSICWIEEIITEVTTPEGEIIKLGIERDVTKFRQTMEERRVIEMQYNLLSHIINNIGETIWISSAAQGDKFVYITESIKSILGYTNTDFYNDPGLWVNLIHSKNKNEIKAKLKGDFLHSEYLEYKVKDKNGIMKMISNYINKFVSPHDGVFYWGIIKDFPQNKKNL